jgi:hypothetical protein
MDVWRPREEAFLGPENSDVCLSPYLPFHLFDAHVNVYKYVNAKVDIYVKRPREEAFLGAENTDIIYIYICISERHKSNIMHISFIYIYVFLNDINQT